MRVGSIDREFDKTRIIADGLLMANLSGQMNRRPFNWGYISSLSRIERHPTHTVSQGRMCFLSIHNAKYPSKTVTTKVAIMVYPSGTGIPTRCRRGTRVLGHHVDKISAAGYNIRPTGTLSRRTYHTIATYYRCLGR